MRDVYVAIARAAQAGRGMRLSAHEVWLLINRDEAIIAAAETCETECVCDIMRCGVLCETCQAIGGSDG